MFLTVATEVTPEIPVGNLGIWCASRQVDN